MSGKPEKIVVSDFKVTDAMPKVTNPEVQKLLPTRLKPQFASFQISGVDTSVPNAIRRTILCEMLVKAMTAEFHDFSSTDPYHKPKEILHRLEMIPILQSTPKDSVFELKVTNTTPHRMHVKSSQIQIVRGPKELPFNETFTLFTLEPGAKCHIRNIKIKEAYGYDNGTYVMALAPTSIALDVEPYNPYTKTGVRSSVANPQKWRIEFGTNGIMDPKDIIRLACDNIIERAHIENLFESIKSNNSIHVLRIENESATIANLIQRSVLHLFPNVDITCDHNSSERYIVIKMRTDEDPKKILSEAIGRIERIYKTIKDQI